MTSILTDLQVLDIFHHRMEGASLRAIAEQSGISRQYAMKVLNREARKSVEIPQHLINIAANHQPLKQAKTMKRNLKIHALIKEGYTQLEISQKLKCGTATVCRVVNGK